MHSADDADANLDMDAEYDKICNRVKNILINGSSLFEINSVQFPTECLKYITSQHEQGLMTFDCSLSGKKISALLDYGASREFMDSSFAASNAFVLTELSTAEKFSVKLANGISLECKHKIANANLRFKGFTHRTDIYIYWIFRVKLVLF